MARSSSAQTKVLRKRLLIRVSIALLLYAAVVAAVFYLFSNYVGPTAENWVKETVSGQWERMDQREFDHFRREMREEGRRMEDFEVHHHEDGSVEVRDIRFFMTLRMFKYPLEVLLVLGGLLVIVLVELGRVLKHFDSLSHAVNGLFKDRAATIDLPDELSIVRSELTELQERSLADERAAQAAEQRKNELVAYLAHDIRTPLTSVLGYLSLLKENPELPQEERERYTDIALDKAVHLDYLVNEFFDITRYNLQDIPVQRKEVDVAMLCAQVADGFYPVADQKDIEIELHLPAERLAQVDANMLARALSNIMRNALSYASTGTQVKLTLADVQVDGKPGFAICIEDEGLEIPPEQIKDVFDKFFRASAARSTDRGGAGLGLAIAHEIVLAHGGDIQVSSGDGRTCFRVLIPDVTE